MLDPHKTKFHKLYWEYAFAAARQSVATREKVGAVLVLTTGVISVGWNGKPPGFPNECESQVWLEDEARYKTDPDVIHAERNAIDKLTCQGISTKGAILFTTLSPCLECAKSLINLGLKAIYYNRRHDCTEGIDLLQRAGIPVYQVLFTERIGRRKNDL